jgi:DNA repair protein RecN (Recombination protein N)
MLTSLYAKNFALIREVRVEFDKGLNIITGETGAGKSILIGAVGALLGERLSKDVVRSGTEKATVEGVFKGPFSDEISTVLKENDINIDENEILICREMQRSGRSRCFINDTPVPLQFLIDVGNMLVDLHGQHQHQLLLQVARHIDYLDDFARLQESLNKMHECYQRYTTLHKLLETLLSRQQQLQQSRELYEFQLKEIQEIDPHPEEDEQLDRDERVLRNSELLFEKLTILFKTLYENDGSVVEILKTAENNLSELLPIDKKFKEYQNELSNARITVEDIAHAMHEYSEKATFDADRLDTIRRRIVMLNSLKKKYGGTIPALLEHKAKLLAEIAMVENLHDDIQENHKNLEEEYNKLKNISLHLSAERGKASDTLSNMVMAELAHLGMSHAKFSVSNQYKNADHGYFLDLDGQKITVNQKGVDQIEFLISANPGEPLKPLTNVASGGEISRIMLALKTLLANADKVPVLIFDEIDIGISGRIAQAVGHSLKKLADLHQVLCITHLPQIASMADHHFLVEKITDGKETVTQIRKLNTDERTMQIARLFGGEVVTETHLQSALELIQEANRRIGVN